MDTQGIEILKQAKANIIELEQEIARLQEEINLTKQAAAELESFKDTVIKGFDLVQANVVPPYTSINQLLDVVEGNINYSEPTNTYEKAASFASDVIDDGSSSDDFTPHYNEKSLATFASKLSRLANR